MAKGFNPEQVRQIAEIVQQVAREMLQPSAPLVQVPVAQEKQETLDLSFSPAPKVRAQTTPSLTVVAPLPVMPIQFPMDPICGVDGERFIELAKKGKGEYSELANTLFALIRARILEDNGGIEYMMLTKSDRTALNERISKLMSDRVNTIRKLIREEAKRQETTAPVAAKAQTPATQPTERIAASAATVERPAPKLVLPPIESVSYPIEGGQDLKDVVVEKDPDSLGPVGVRELANLVAFAKANFKLGDPYLSTLRNWAAKESNQKRPGLAKKILRKASMELGVPMKGDYWRTDLGESLLYSAL